MVRKYLLGGGYEVCEGWSEVKVVTPSIELYSKPPMCIGLI